jgi:hypothetical protein
MLLGVAISMTSMCGVAAADGLWDDLVGGGEEVVDLVEGVAVGAAHEAVADESDAELFLCHKLGWPRKGTRDTREPAP